MALLPISSIDEIAVAQGTPLYLGSYNATTTSKTNAEVGTPFCIVADFLRGKVLLIHNAGAVAIRILPVATSTGVVTTVRDAAGFGAYVAAGEKATLRMLPSMGYLAVITESATANVDVHELV